MKNSAIRCIAMLLVLAFMVQLLPAQAFATELTGTTVTGEPMEGEIISVEAGSVVSEETAGAPAYILYEEELLRETDVKQFRLSDGSMMAVNYGEPVHYENAAGVLLDIDSGLKTARTVAGQPAAFETTANVWNGLYAQTIQNDFLFAMERAGYKVSFSLVTNEPDAGLNPVTPPVEVMSMDPEPEEAAQQENAVLISEQPETTELQDQTTPEAAEEPAVTSDEEMSSEEEATEPEEVADSAVESEIETEPVGAEENAATAPVSVVQMDFESRQIAAQILDTSANAATYSLESTTLGDSQLRWQEQIYPENLHSALVYEDVFPGVDFQYENGSTAIKESIIVNELQDSYTYVFRLDLTGLEPVLSENGCISLSDAAGNLRFEIPSPYMVDNAGEYSDAVNYTLNQDTDGTWLLTVSADAEWISNAELPVAIDPTIIDKATSGGGIYMTYVRSGAVDSTPDVSGAVLTGWDSTREEMRTYGYIKELPYIPNGSVLVDAQLGLVQSNWITGSASSVPVSVYDVNYSSTTVSSETKFEELTWSTRPDANGASTVEEDTQNMSNSTYNNQYYWWNLTRLATQWYDNGSSNTRGFVMAVENAKSVATRVPFRGTDSSYTYYRPIFAVTYRSATGIEGYYTYQTQNIGRAGTGYVGDFNHQLTLVRNDVSISSTINPLNLSLVYNSDWANYVFNEDSNASSRIQNYNGYPGAGWKLSAQETCNYIDTTGIEDAQYSSYIIYNDADGTAHFFYPNSSGNYSDEDGMGLTCTRTVNSSGHNLYTMSDEKGNVKYFYNGYILYSKDSCGNYIYYCYDTIDYNASTIGWKPTTYTNPHKLTSIWRINVGDEPRKLVSLNYGSDCYLTSIVNHIDNQTTRFTYDLTDGNGVKYLTKVTMPDGAEALYEYDAKYRLIAAYDAESNYGVEYNYNYYHSRIQNTYEFNDDTGSSVQTKRTTAATGRDYGARMHGYRMSAYLKTYRDYGNDHEPNTADDILTYYTFDAFGRTTCCYSTNSNRTEVYGAQTATYTNNTSTSKKNNRTTSAATVGIQGYNLLENSSLETADAAANSAKSWTIGSINAGSNAVIKSDGPVRSGSRAMKSWIGGASNDLELTFYQPVTLDASTTYTFSAYANSSGLTPNATVDGGLYIAFADANGEILESSHVIDYKTVTAIENGWERLQVSFTPETEGEYRVVAVHKGLAGVGGFDDLQLEAGQAPTAYNLLQDGRFENEETGWTPTVTPQTDSTSSFGDNVLQIVGSSTAQKRTAQTVTVNVPATSTFIVSGWAQATASPTGVAEIKNTTDRYFGLIVTLKYGTNETEVHYIPFNSTCTAWQYTSGMVVPKKSGTVTSVKVECAYDNNINTAHFDNISLTLEPVQTYSYNDDGKLVASTSTGTTEQSYTYSGANLTKMVAGGNGTYTYTYNEANQVRTATNDGVTLTVNHTDVGNVNSTNWGPGTSGSTNLKSFASYDGTENYATVISDGNGIASYYSYSNDKVATSKTGILNQTTYGYYTASERLYQTYQAGVISLFYGYNNGLLSNLSRKLYRNGTALWQSYQFAYDDFGNTTGIYVSADDNTTGGAIDENSRQLASYAYDDEVNNGYLTRMTYANGDYVEYAYDQFGRLIAETYHDPAPEGQVEGAVVAGYVYVYAANGDLAKQYSIGIGDAPDTVDSFEYDSLGRLIRSRSEVDGTTTQRTEHIYDTDNRITEQSWQLGNKTYTQDYTYRSADGALTKVVTEENGTTKDTLNYSYDSIKRLLNRSNSVYTQTYSYKQITADGGYGEHSSTLVSKLQYTAPDGGSLSALEFNYTYDANGNITKVTQNGSTLATYTYDGQGQLIKEVTGGTTYNYTYDTAGNILSVSGGSTASYTYDNSQWRDLLTAYNGQTITYDAAGNPTTYYDGTTMTWTQGRRLAEIKNGDTTVASYTYDMSGIRTSKTVGDTTYNYITQNGQVVRQTWGDNTLDIVYDNNNQPYYCIYTPDGGTATVYYYITNLQGDVVKLVTANGAEAASYTYNAWGAVEVTNANGYTIGDINPIRYRGYYYDTESGFYYLQSRYYDPEICRFVNADSYASTGQGLLGCNMFAYCNNNPISCIDTDGDRLISLGMSRLIHNAVARRVARSVDGVENIFIRKTTDEGEVKRGFLDVYDPNSNSYYEIKSRETSGRPRTIRQMEKYDGSKCNYSSQPIIRGTTQVSGNFTYAIYDVSYEYVSPGLVVYDATVNQQRAAEVRAGVTIIGMIIGICLLGPCGAGAGAGAAGAAGGAIMIPIV